MPRLLAVGILLGLALPASAADAPRLAIVGVHQEGLDAAAQEAAVEKIAEAVDIIGKADGLETNEVVRAIRGRESVILNDALLANGRQDLLNGKNLYNQAQTDAAVTALESAVIELSRAVSATNTVKDLWEAWVYLGTAYVQSDERAKAESCFRAAASLNPDRNPNAAQFPPDVVGLFETERKRLKAAAVDFTVETTTAATVFIDGRELGPSPVTITGVYPGMHHIVAKAEGSHGYKLLSVEQTPPGTVSIELGAAVIGEADEAKHARSRQIAGLYRAIGTHADKVDLLLIAGESEGNLALQLYAPLADAFSRPVTAPLNGSAGDIAADAIPSLMEMVSTDGKILPDAVHPLAIPLMLDSNRHLASLLLDPREPSAVVTPPPNGGIGTESPTVSKKKSPVVPIVVGVVLAGAAGAGGYFGYTALRSDEPRYGGSVVIGPF